MVYTVRDRTSWKALHAAKTGIKHYLAYRGFSVSHFMSIIPVKNAAVKKALSVRHLHQKPAALFQVLVYEKQYLKCLFLGKMLDHILGHNDVERFFII